MWQEVPCLSRSLTGAFEGLTGELARREAKHVRVRVLEMHINDKAFAQAAAKSLRALILESRKIFEVAS